MNSDTLLLRHIHPSFVQQGRVSSQAFRPTPKDQNKLSVYDGDKIAPAASHEHYTQTLGLSSVGVLGITVAECAELQLRAAPEPAPFPEHVVIDFSGVPQTSWAK